MKGSRVRAGFCALAVVAASAARAEDSTLVKVSLENHHFVPAEPTAPAGKPIVIELSNQDSTPSEFESKTLRVEKVVAGGGKITVRIRALAPG